MSTAQSLIVAVFDNSTMAERAINDLKDKGFSNDEILYSSRQGRGGFFENLKSWITGEETASIGDVAKNLRDMGVPEEAANYYANEREAGHPIVAVSSPGHEQNARNVLSRYGGHSHDVAPSRPAADMRPGGMASTPGLGPTTTPSSTAARSEGLASAPGMTPAATPGSTGMRPGGMASAPGMAPIDTTSDQSLHTTGYQPGEIHRQPDQLFSQRERSLETGEARIPLREEQLNVEKQRVQKGEVRIHKEIVTEQQHLDVPVTREEVVIEHLPASEVRAADMPISQGETIRVPVSEEQVNVTKQTVETGEIDVRKRAVQDEQRVSGTVRREEPRIEKSGDVHVRRDDNDLRP